MLAARQAASQIVDDVDHLVFIDELPTGERTYQVFRTGLKTVTRVTDPRVTEGLRPGPRVTDPRVTDPRVTDPRVIDPRVTDPRVTDPRVTDPRIPDPTVTLSPDLATATVEWTRGKSKYGTGYRTFKIQGLVI